MVKYHPEKDLPEFAREFQTLSPSKLAEIVLNRRNKKVTSESVTMWFKRHPEIYDELSREINIGLPTETEEASISIFQNGFFQEIPSVKNWLLEMNARKLAKGTISSKLITLRQLCEGRFPLLKIDLRSEGKWVLKHPDRLTLKDALEMIYMLDQRTVDTRYFKHVFKEFLLSKGVVIGKKIVVGHSFGHGKYAKLFVGMSKLVQMLLWIKQQDCEAFVCDLFMFKTATRISATLKALIENIEGSMITVYDKGRRSKYPQGHPWEKHLDGELMPEIQTIIGERKSGTIFNIQADKLAELTRQALKKFAPEILEKYPELMPNHFWRHMFAQHMLRLFDWNYAKVAALGGWTPQALEESYGKPPEETVKSWASQAGLTMQLGLAEEVKA